MLIEQLVPISAEEFRRILDNAPLDDEPVTPELRRRLDEVQDMLRRQRQFTLEEAVRSGDLVCSQCSSHAILHRPQSG